MGEFKTSAFGGYNKKQVDAHISELELENARLVSSQNSLREQLDAAGENLKNAVAAAEKRSDGMASDLDEKLASLREENSALLNERYQLIEQNSEKSREIAALKAKIERNDRELREKFGTDYASAVSNIGKIYVRAYQSGAAVTGEAENMAHDFMNKVNDVSVRAEGEISSALERCESIRDEVAALVGYLSKRVAQIDDDTNGLVEKFRTLAESFGSAAAMRTETENKINRHIADYESAATEFIRRSSNQGGKPVEVEPLYDTTVNDAISGDNKADEIKIELNPEKSGQAVAAARSQENTAVPQAEKEAPAVAEKPTENEKSPESQSEQPEPVVTVTYAAPAEPVAEQPKPAAKSASAGRKKAADLSEDERQKLIREALMRYSKK